jgi:hypothetical protein
MQAILFDREDVVVGVNQILEVARVVDRCQIVGENFFDSLRQSGALYLLSRVLLNTELSDFLSHWKYAVANIVELNGSNYKQ